MSLDKKSVHVRLAPAQHGRLSVMADFHDRDIADLASQLLEKMIVAEYHDFRIAAERYARLGLSGRGGDSKGAGDK